MKFVIGELPNDMKMLAFLGGELTNSATFYSTFANVSQHDHADLKGTFGEKLIDTWRPWDYPKRLKDAKKVQNFKDKLNLKLMAKTARSKVTSFIASLKSRQEFAPLVGTLIERAHIEPLHLKNNACALVHRQLLKLAVSWSNLPSSCSSFAQVPAQSLF